MNLVLDPSVAAKWFLADESVSAASDVLDRLAAGDTAHAPALFRWEIENVLLSALRAGRIDASEIDAALEALRDLPVYLEPAGDRFFSSSEIRLAQAYDLTAYDAAYLASALDLDAELITTDARLAKAARDIGIATTLVAG